MRLEILDSNSVKQYEFLKNIPSENGFESPFLGMTFDEYKNEAKIRNDEALGINLQPGYVPQTIALLVDDSDNYVGIFKIRHYLTDFLRNGAGHIGYAIAKNYRGKGYGTKGLELSIDYLKNLPDFNDNEVYLSCDLDNFASLKVMINNGGKIHHSDTLENYVRIKLQ